MGSLSGGVDIKGYLQIKELEEVKWKIGMFLMIEKDGLFVPFEVMDFYFKNEIPYVRLCLFPFKDILKWKNSGVFVENKRVNLNKNLLSIVGFEVYDETSGTKIGKVKEIQEYSLNRVLILENNNKKEILIPYHYDLITKRGENKLYMKLPENLLKINK